MSEWRKGLRDYSSRRRDIDRELEELFQREERMEERGEGIYSQHFKDLNKIRKQFRDACRKITALGESESKHMFDENTSDSDTDEELPPQDRVRPMSFGDEGSWITYKLNRDRSLFDSEAQKEEWLKEVIQKGETDVSKIFDRFENEDTDEEDDKILDELEKEWKEMEKLEMSREERAEVANLRERIEEGLIPEINRRKGRKTYLQQARGENTSSYKGETLKLPKKKYTKTKKDIYTGFCNKI